MRTLATAGDKDEDGQELKLALTTALIRLSIGEDRELRAEIIEAGALPLLVKLMAARMGPLADNLQHCAAGCMGCIARGDAESREALFDSGAVDCLVQSLEFSSAPLVQQECCTALGPHTATDEHRSQYGCRRADTHERAFVCLQRTSCGDRSTLWRLRARRVA